MSTLTKPSLLLAEVVLSDIYINCVIVWPGFRAPCMVYKPYYIHSSKIVPRLPFYFELWRACDVWNLFGGSLLFLIIDNGDYIYVDIDETLLLLAELAFSGINCVIIFKRLGLGLRIFHS